MAARPSTEYDTIIIGAGISGLASASRLLESADYQSGKKKLLVLEGRSRIGGRIGAVEINGFRLDTGANWIHGIGTRERPNPLMSILPHKKYRSLDTIVSFRPSKQRRLSSDATVKTVHQRPTVSIDVPQVNPLLDHAYDDSGDEWTVLGDSDLREDSNRTTTGSNTRPSNSSKDLVIPPQIASTVFGALWGMIGNLHEKAVAATFEDVHSTPLIDVICKDEDFSSALKKVPPEYRAMIQALPQFIENMEAGPLTMSSPVSGTTKPGLSLSEFAIDDFDGDQVFLRDGYIAIVNELAKELNQRELIRLNTVIRTIDSSTESISISTNQKHTYSAKNVVCTIPLGVLQYHLSQERIKPSISEDSQDTRQSVLFIPPLPSSKLEAIDCLGFGVLDKIFLVYPKTWWTEEPFRSVVKRGLIRHQFPPGDDTTETIEETDTFWGFTSELAGLSVSETDVSSGPRALTVMNLHSLTGFTALSAFVSCGNAIHVEALSDTAAASIVHRAMTKWFGTAPPKPTAVHVTRWHQDPFSRGSYTHMVTNQSHTSHREEFAKHVVRKNGCALRFAGEHTSRDHFATAHGALLSGYREADAILQQDTEKRD